MSAPVWEEVVAPAHDPEHFRTTFRKQRWYVDPLPACDLAPATSNRWPSLSALKRSWSGTFSKKWTDGNVYDLDPLRVALYVDEHIAHLATLPTNERVPTMAKAAKADLNAASARGTAVHSAIEALILDGDEEAARKVCHPDYWTTVLDLVASLDPTVLHAETVAISRSKGWAGTFDLIATIKGSTYLIDWKSRGGTSGHGAYEAEGAQLGGYASADYIIAPGTDGTAVRAPLPHLDGGLVVSIKPDGWEAYPVDLDIAKAACVEMHEAWLKLSQGKSTGRKSIGKATWSGPDTLEADLAASLPIEDRTAYVVERIGALKNDHPERVDALRQKWDLTGIAKQPPWDDSELDKLSIILHHVEADWPGNDPAAIADKVAADEAAAVVPEAPAQAPTWPAPDEGDLVTDDDAEALRETVGRLEGDDIATMRAWVLDSREQDRPWSYGTDITTRGFAVARAALRCIRAFPYGGRDARTRAAIAYVLTDDLQPAWRTGAVLGSLSIAQADELADLADLYRAKDKTVRTVIDAAADAA